MYEPWGYREQEAYQSDVNEANIGLDGFFAKVSYNKNDNKIHFGNRLGKDVGYLDVNEFVNSGSVVEFKDGLQVNEGEVSVLVDSATEKSYVTQIPYLTVSKNGVKVEGINLAVDTEKNRAVEEETRLDDKIDQETARAIEKEEELDEKINQIVISGDPRVDELIEKLGYKDNDTLVTSNEHEVAFGEYNVSNTSEDASGQTVFSVGIGTNEADRKNAFEVRKDGSVFMWVEGEYMNVNILLGQISHEIYDTNP